MNETMKTSPNMNTKKKDEGVKENNVWRRQYNFELYAAYNEPKIITFIKIRDDVGWAMQNRCERIGRRPIIRPKLRYMEQARSLTGKTKHIKSQNGENLGVSQVP